MLGSQHREVLSHGRSRSDECRSRVSSSYAGTRWHLHRIANVPDPPGGVRRNGHGASAAAGECRQKWSSNTDCTGYVGVGREHVRS